MSEEPKRWKRGDVGPDGRVFWAYDRCYKDGERWVSNRKFNEYIEKQRLADVRRRKKPDYKTKKSNWLKARFDNNPQKFRERNRRFQARKTFEKIDGSSYNSFISTMYRPALTLKMIFGLSPDPGQTLAELIHELSGYPMEVCEMIANPPPVEEPEPEKLDNPPPPFTLPGGPDLF